MKKSLLIILGLAALAGGLTVSLLTFYVQPATIVTAGRDLAAGTRLTADLLNESRVPKGAVPQGAFSSAEQAVGLVLTADRVGGDAITSYVAGDSTAAAGIPAQLAPDHVAIAVNVDQATGLAGHRPHRATRLGDRHPRPAGHPARGRQPDAPARIADGNCPAETAARGVSLHPRQP
jgi:Flp pilus assembly protein CpaB